MCVVAQGLQSATFLAAGWRVRQRDCEYRGVNYPFGKVVPVHFIKETSASRNAGFAVLSTAKASSLGDASLTGVARGGLGAKIRLLGLLRQGRTVFGAPQACFTEG